MDAFKRLIHEIHRRSLWQVLGIFLAASWGVLQVVEVLTETAGLPDWTPSMALVLLLIGLPICLGTAIVQEGMPGHQEGDAGGGHDASSASASEPPEPSEPAVNLAAGTGSLDRPTTRPRRTQRLLTWRNAILGGVGAFTLLGFSLVAYFFMWEAGIGPVGNLVAQGVIAEGDRVVLSDFEDDTDEGLGEVVTEALRVDLTEAAVLDLVEQSDILPTLELMQVAPGTPLDAELAREISVRSGVEAVLDGGVARAGTGYLLTATLREAASGRALATFRVAADGPDEIISSIDKLSQDVREKSGEPLRQIKAGEPLERVTTSSLEALRLYSEAERLFGSMAQTRVIELLEQAVVVDPEFAMAWRKLAAAYTNDVSYFERLGAAATQAFEKRDRLTTRERHLAEAMYYNTILNDQPRTIEAYRAILDVDPDHPTALNNIANAYNATGEYEQGSVMYRRAIDGPGRTRTAFSNLILNELRLGNYEQAADVLRAYEAAYPDGQAVPVTRFHVALMNGAISVAEELGRSRLSDASLGLSERSEAAQWLATIAYREGRFSEARQLHAQAARIAAQVSPALEATRLLVGAYRESALGDPARALEQIRHVTALDVFPQLPATFTDVMAIEAALLGDLDLADQILARLEAARPEVFGDGAELIAPATLRVLREGPEGAVQRMEAVQQEIGCIGRYCGESARAWAAMREGDLRTAIGLYEQLADRGGDIYPIMAIEPLRATLSLAPLYEAVGDTERAIATYDALIAMWEDGDAEARDRVAGFRSRRQALGAGGS